MISNHILRGKITGLKNQKSKLVDEKLELSEKIRELGITKQAAWKQKNGHTEKIDNDLLNLREVYAKRILRIDKEVAQLNVELRELFDLEKSDENLSLLKVFEEIFTTDQLREIRIEAQRRMRGEHPFKLSFNVGESIEIKEQNKKYKKQVLELLDSMVKFRMELTNLIDAGCDKFGKSEFLTFISPLNRLIMPVAELEKTKRKIIG